MAAGFAAADPAKLEFADIAGLIRAQAGARPQRPALVQDGRALSYRELDRLMDRAAVALQAAGCAPGEPVAICAAASIKYLVVMMGALRAGAAVALLPPSLAPAAVAGMLADSGARTLFLDATAPQLEAPGVCCVALDACGRGTPLTDWLAPAGATPKPVAIGPRSRFAILYSSGTTAAPKGIVQSHGMRWAGLKGAAALGFDADCVSLVSTPLYSNTTLVALLPTLACGGTAVLMDKFEAEAFLALSERHRVTHAMLVPTQYARILEAPGFATRDLSSYRMKLCTSAPFPAALKAEVIRRWPGHLIEFYGMTEGGGTCALAADLHPDKLHTVGCPIPGHDMRVIDEDGHELPPGGIGEVVGRSPGMMEGYHRLPILSAESEWRDAQGVRYIRSGDLGRFDADGFLELMGRKKDLIISGGQNVYPADLEAVLAGHQAVAEAAVVGAPSPRWGETPAAFVVLKPGTYVTRECLRAWADRHLGKTQRLGLLEILPELPRSPIGKVLKQELRERCRQAQSATGAAC
jgi:acyl-CoA synthetase (AMP-forming)/AMP-acid ligase II